ncbi:MAG: response regulator, partial [Cyanobacteriota bacterium]
MKKVPPLVKGSILVVEDEKIIAKDIATVLKKFGYTVPAIASSGEEAMRRLEESPVDLVLMDIVLKGDIDGVEAAKRITERFNIPVVHLTAYADDDTLARVKETQPFGYIIKPFKERELYTTIEIALHNHQQSIENRKLEEKKIEELRQNLHKLQQFTDV